jgi:hypothetical protein
VSHPGLGSVARLRAVRTRSISPENFDGSAGGGGRATEGTGAECARDLGPGWKISPSVDIPAGETFDLAAIDGPGRITHIWITTHTDNWRTLLLRAYWDGADEPAIEVPYGDFFAQGWGRFAQVDSEPIAVNPHGGFNSYWPMPFQAGARLTLENLSAVDVRVYYQITFEVGDDYAGQGYLHAQWRRSDPLKRLTPHTLVEGVEGQGQYVGTYLGRQQQRLVGRGRDQVLSRRRRGISDDLRHRDGGLLRRSLELRRARAGLHRVLHAVSGAAPGDPAGRALREPATVRHVSLAHPRPDPFRQPAAGRHPGARMAVGLAVPAAA